MEIEGFVEAISYKNKGVKINGKWYTIPEEFLSKISKNDLVKIEVDDYNNILNLEIISKAGPIDKDIKIASLNAAIEVLKLTYQYGKFSTEFETAENLTSSTLEKEADKITTVLLKIQRRIENWLK